MPEVNILAQNTGDIFRIFLPKENTIGSVNIVENIQTVSRNIGFYLRLPHPHWLYMDWVLLPIQGFESLRADLMMYWVGRDSFLPSIAKSK